MKYLKIETLNIENVLVEMKQQDLVSKPSRIEVVSLNRPEVKNAFHPGMIAELTQYFIEKNKSKLTDLIVLTGEARVFCAGADLNWMKEMVQYSLEQNIEDSEKLWTMFEAIRNCMVPVIGWVQSAAFGGALGLMACCDYVMSDVKTQFCFSEVKLGLAPAVISSFVLEKISDGQARPLMLSAEVFNAETALKIGLVHHILDFSEVSMLQGIKKFLMNGPQAMIETKKLLNALKMHPSWSEQKKLTTQVISQRRVSSEGQERLKKFIEKR